ncbi:MAG: biopolymer transporter ExbD [Bacteroidales bacterium]|nr:biopolymer transporter ExbD [Bacteroidales bacterium]
MAEIAETGGQQHKGKKRAKKHSTHIDMTPMVDLACLLITFFVLTSAFTKAKVMEIVYPERQEEGEESNAPQISERRAFHIILTENDRILWYAGRADPTRETLPTLYETDYSADGIRRILLERNKSLFTQIQEMEEAVLEGRLDVPRDSINAMRRQMMTDDDVGPIVLIKATDGVRYKNMVDIVDEMAITNIARYSIVDINEVEKVMVRRFFAAESSGAASSN